MRHITDPCKMNATDAELADLVLGFDKHIEKEKVVICVRARVLVCVCVCA